jgi:hypothetical protein
MKRRFRNRYSLQLIQYYTALKTDENIAISLHMKTSIIRNHTKPIQNEINLQEAAAFSLEQVRQKSQPQRKLDYNHAELEFQTLKKQERTLYRWIENSLAREAPQITPAKLTNVHSSTNRMSDSVLFAAALLFSFASSHRRSHRRRETR